MSDQSDHMQDDFGGDDALAAELSLGLLTGDTLVQAERRARIDIGFAALVEDWNIRFAQMCEDIEPVAPPAGLFRKIANEAYPESRKRIWQSLGILPALLGAGAAALVLILALNFGGLLQTGTPTASLAARMAAEDNSLVIAAAYIEDGGRLFLERQIGERPPNRDLELWIIIGDNAAVSLGVLESEGAISELIVPVEFRDALPGAVLAITDEPIGGSPTGSATGSILAVGEITSL